jgi:hypothetical protein
LEASNWQKRWRAGLRKAAPLVDRADYQPRA